MIELSARSAAGRPDGRGEDRCDAPAVRHLMKVWMFLKPGDWILIGALSLLLILSFFVPWMMREEGRYAVVMTGGRRVLRVALDEDRDIHVQGPLGETRIEVRGGQVWVSEAPCPHHICMKMGKIRYSQEVIVCVPNRVVIRIEGASSEDIDGMTM